MHRAHKRYQFCNTGVQEQTYGAGIGNYGDGVHREIVPPRETVAIARVAIAIVGRGGWGNLPYTVANENQMKA